MKMINSHTYRVGGFVRDTLLGLNPKDIDYVVVGLTPDVFIEAGFKPVGADFPVFLHPDTDDEYALARSERSTGRGHKAFETRYDPSITLEEDLLRRDLTINAMAMDHDGVIIDPCNGQADLKNRVLRHVSNAFEEDPLRILRVARFVARFAHLGFRIDDTTSRLMQKMCQEGQLRDLPKERIWKEVSRALMEPTPSAFFETLNACGGLDDWFPEIKALIGVEQPIEHHPEICTFKHTMLALEQTRADDLPVAARWAVVCHDLGKAMTPVEERPKHHGHEKAGVPLVETLSRRVGAPKDALTLARQLCEHHTQIHRALELSPKSIIKLVQVFDGLRRPDNFQLALKAAKCDALGRTGFEHKAYPQEAIMTTMLNALKTINEGDIARTCQDNPKLIPQRIHQERMRVIKSALREQGKIRVEKHHPTSDHTLV